MKEKSYGLVEPKNFSANIPIELFSGDFLNHYELVYETYGKLNKNKNNAILICHALNASHHAAGYYESEGKKNYGWWDNLIGPNKPVDTNKFFVISINNLGGCHGSTGPKSINPLTKKPFGSTFPFVTVEDWVEVQSRLADHLEIDKFFAVIGGSLGGMQALEWSITKPNRVENVLIIAATSRLSAQNIAFNQVARQAITSDPNFHNGDYYEKKVIPYDGLRVARMLGHITYQSDFAMMKKFGRQLMETSDSKFNININFQIESYLEYQADKFAKSFDANTYLRITKALDNYDPASRFENGLIEALSNKKNRFLVVSFTSDWRFAPNHSLEIVNALIHNKSDISYVEIDAPEGHDAFLLENENYHSSIRSFLK